jgi:hypothetical protein
MALLCSFLSESFAPYPSLADHPFLQSFSSFSLPLILPPKQAQKAVRYFGLAEVMVRLVSFEGKFPSLTHSLLMELC